MSHVEMVESGENLKALLFLTLGTKYFNLVFNSLGETVKSGNPHIVSSDTEETIWDNYFEKTKWSDFMIIEPILFNFYHGLELFLKGLLLLCSQDNVKAQHGLLNLFKQIDPIDSIAKDVKEIIREHLVISENDTFLYTFLKENNASIDQLYEALRYPSDKSFQNLNSYISLHYKEDGVIEYFKKIMQDIKTIQKFGVAFYRNKGVGV